MTGANSFDPDQMLERIVTALREQPVPEFRDPSVASPALAGASPADTPEPLAPRTAGRSRRPAWWRLVAACAILSLATAAWLVLRPQTTLADVASALLKQTWVHSRTVYADESANEAWFSPARDIFASQYRGSARYEDYRLRIYYSYDPDEKVLYRGPVVWQSRAQEFNATAQALRVLLQAERLPDKLPAHLDFLDFERNKVQVIDQRVEKITEQDHAWLDYRLTVKYPDLDEPARMLFRVDAATKLPHICRIEGVENDKPVSCETRFDYPETGPADIYELGVPKGAELVDRVPSADVNRIVESHRAGREWMDNYRAVVVKQTEGLQRDWWRATPEILYRKGDRFRRDFVVPGEAGPGAERPAASVDLGEWWFERAKLFRFYPVSVQIGPTGYMCTAKEVADPNASVRYEIGSVNKVVYNTLPGDTFPSDYSMRPEFSCRPLLGIGGQHQQPVLDQHPTEGPPGCMLLTVRHTTPEGRVNAQGVGIPDENRFWIDPLRDFIVMRWDMVTRDGDSKETIIWSLWVEEVARSPRGVWYATTIRLKDAVVRHQDGKKYDDVYRIYVDFEADLADELFEPPVPGRIE